MLTPDQCTNVAELLRTNLTEPAIFDIPRDVDVTREERREPADVWDLIDALTAQAAVMEGVDAFPQAVVTFKVPANGYKTVWVTDTEARVRTLLADAKRNPTTVYNDVDCGMVRLTVVRGFKGSDLWTQHDNVSSIEAYR